MAIGSLVLGLLLTWGMGVALLAALPASRERASAPGEWPWLGGCGWFVGIFLVTLWMRALSALGVPFAIVPIGAPIAATAALFAWLAWRTRGSPASGWQREAARAAAGADLASWRRVVWVALLGWLAVHFAMLLAEDWWRPLYPWDAWTQWATKARVWFALKTMAPFVGGGEWLGATTATVYHDAAPHYPATVPLIQVWSATLLGEWNDALINLPWWLTGVAFGFALYGALRRLRFDALPALIGTWIVLSLPIFDVHIALAGYADLFMSTFFTLGAIASLHAVETRRWPDAIVATLLLAACIVIKNPGIVWVLTLAPAIAVALLGRRGVRFAAFAFAAATMAVLVLAGSDAKLFGYTLHLDFDPPVRALIEAYFTLGNWHLLWYAAVAMLVVGWRHLLSRDVAPFTMIMAAGMAFLMFGFVFTNARQWVEDQSTVNRATLHLAPLVAVWTLLMFRAWAAGLSQPEASIAPA